ncbi:unnamed protein product [Allacma fusca]|uniref:Uncharacterized protein n=1 Tax=Allacma fusca TaxID=39272 RepID=A0A8J2KYQ3_9HEXA|nr:unnamed protein product [Allacma fusca]
MNSKTKVHEWVAINDSRTKATVVTSTNKLLLEYPQMGHVFVCAILVVGIALPFSHANHEDKYLPAVKEAAEKLTPDRFVGDPVLIQSIDRINSKTYYKHLDLVNQGVAIERDISDAGEEIVVIPSKKTRRSKSDIRNRIYLVLKRTPESRKSFYVTYAYVRACLWNDDPQESIDVDGEKIFIEWDLWDDHINDAENARSLGWHKCSSSVFVTCDSKKEEDIFDYSAEVTSTFNLQVFDKGGGVAQPDVKHPEWGVNQVVKSDDEQSFTGSNGEAFNLEEPGDFLDLTMEGGETDTPDDLDFFADLDDPAGSSRSGPDISESELLNRIGWQTQDVPERLLAEMQGAFEHTPFVGFGSCPYKDLNSTDLENIKEPVEAVRFYLFALRTQCSRNHILKLLELFNKGLLTVNGDHSLSIPADNVLAKTPKLTKPEVQDFLRAFETAMFSQVYAAELLEPSVNVTAPDGAKIGRSVFTIVSMALHTMVESREAVPLHYILVIRNLLKTLKSSYVKAVQDNDRVKSCEKCNQIDKDQAFDNVISLKAVQLFITRSLSAVERGLDPYLAYEYFFKRNKNHITEEIKKQIE